MMVETLTFAQDNYLFLLSYQKSTSFYGDRIATDDLPSITEKIEDLIKQEFYPTLIDTDWNIAWIYINNPSYYSNNYKLLIHNEYLEPFNNLFPIKLTKKLKKLLHDWHHSKAFDTIGIKYEVEDGKITTIIDEKRFEHYLRTSKNLKIWLKSGQIFSYKI